MWKLYLWVGRGLDKIRLSRILFGERDRVRIVILARDGQILLVRNWYGTQKWTLPGGGVKRGESESEAAVRELYEETSLKIDPSAVSYVGEYSCDESDRAFVTQCYYASIVIPPDLRPMKNIEIIDTKWFSVSDLPSDLGLEIGNIVKNCRDQRLKTVSHSGIVHS